MQKQILTDRTIKALKPRLKRFEIMDAVVPGFGVRVTESGARSYILIGRFGGAANPTRRTIGAVGAMTLEQARATARQWLELNKAGTDPKVEAERAKRVELAKQRTTFAAVAEDYIARALKEQRTRKVIERDIRKQLIEPWGKRPITEITRDDMISLVEAIADRTPAYAHTAYGNARGLFAWAIERGKYGLEASPCDRIKPTTIIGKRQFRQRTLADAEINAFWRAIERLGYPFGPALQLLLLTGARKSEIGAGRWHEIDRFNSLWTIPPERFKSETSHLIPLSATALQIIEELPRGKLGDHVFSADLGSTPVRGWGNVKIRLDKLMAEELGTAPEPWVIHDLRRTVRTRLASLKVSDIVAEMVIGHGKKGLQRVYDQHTYESEMREALELWAAKLRDIIEPPPPNVRQLREARV